MTSANSKQNPLAAVGGIVGAIVGVALSRYSGPSLIVPGATAFLLFLIFDKTSVRPPHFRGAITLILAHVTWFVAAAMLLGTWEPVIIDVVALGLGVAWIWLRPGLMPCIFLGIVELVTLGINLNSFMAASVGSEAHRALLVHLLLRIGAIAFLAVGYRRFKAEPAMAAGVSPDGEAETGTR